MACPPICIDDYSDQRRFMRKLLELVECILTDTNVLVTQNTRYDWEVLCDPYTEEPIWVRFQYTTDNTTPITLAAFNKDGTPYAGSINDLVACEYIGGTASGLDAEEALFCDDGVQKTRVDIYTAGVITTTFWLDVLGAATTAPADPALVQAGACFQQGQINTTLLCDSGTPFLANVTFVDGIATDLNPTELDGVTPYVIVGTVSSCSSESPDALSVIMLCDVNAGVPTQFLRRIQIDPTGVVTITNTTLSGTAAYVVTGTVTRCEDPDPFVVMELCDVNAGVPTPFLRRITINESGTVTIVNTTLSGSASYTVTGTVELCCCEADPATETNAVVVREVVTGADTITAGKTSISITNAGADIGTVEGVDLPVGMTWSFQAYFNPVVNEWITSPEIDLDGTDTELYVATTED